jgi:hypothetical protein
VTAQDHAVGVRGAGSVTSEKRAPLHRLMRADDARVMRMVHGRSRSSISRSTQMPWRASISYRAASVISISWLMCQCALVVCLLRIAMSPSSRSRGVHRASVLERLRMTVSGLRFST